MPEEVFVEPRGPDSIDGITSSEIGWKLLAKVQAAAALLSASFQA